MNISQKSDRETSNFKFNGWTKFDFHMNMA